MSEDEGSSDITLETVKERFRESADLLEHLSASIGRLQSAEQMAEGTSTLLAQTRDAVEELARQAGLLVESGSLLQERATVAITEAAKVLHAQEIADLRAELVEFQADIGRRMTQLESHVGEILATTSSVRRALPERWSKRAGQGT